MDIASIGGIILALVAILGAMMMEGGKMSQVTQLTAAMIVIGGTAGAVMVQLPAAGKLKIRHKEHVMLREMMLEGVISILEGLNPRMIETKLRTFLAEGHAAEKAA